MPLSIKFKTLKTRLRDLRKRFLPAKFSKIGAYTAQELDYARSYRILVHAEIEHYFEERALEIAEMAFDLWKNKRKGSKPLVACLANRLGDNDGLPRKIGTSITVTSMAGKAFGQYRQMIHRNNGIKSENILQILLPIGVDESRLDSVWLSTIDGFGQRRGVAAHSAAISYQIDPRDDYQTIGFLMGEIKEIDLLLNDIKRSIR